MKMSNESYSSLKQAIDNCIEHYGKDKIQSHRDNVSCVKDQFVSFCWSMFHACKFDTNSLYKEGLYDSHIETAIKRILVSYK